MQTLIEMFYRHCAHCGFTPADATLLVCELGLGLIGLGLLWMVVGAGYDE